MCTIALSDGPTKRKTIFGNNTNKKELSVTIQNLSEILTYIKKKYTKLPKIVDININLFQLKITN